MTTMKKSLVVLALALLATSQLQAGIEQEIVIFFRAQVSSLYFQAGPFSSFHIFWLWPLA